MTTTLKTLFDDFTNPNATHVIIGGQEVELGPVEFIRLESPQDRLEYLRGEIRAERISYGELAELQDLTPHIQPDDVELLQWAGVPEDVYLANLPD